MPRRSRNALSTIRDPSAAPPSRRRWKRQKTQPELGQIVQPCKPMLCTRRCSSHLPIDQRSERRSGNEPRQGEATEMTPIGGTSQCRTKPSRCSDRHLASNCPHHQAAGLQRTERSPLAPTTCSVSRLKAQRGKPKAKHIESELPSVVVRTALRRARRQIAERGQQHRFPRCPSREGHPGSQPGERQCLGRTTSST